MIQDSIVIIFGVLLSLVALGVAVLKNAGQSSFLYINARIISRSTLIVGLEKMKKLVHSRNLRELINGLKDSEYYHDLDAINKDDIDEFNAALERSTIKSINELEKISPSKFRPIFHVYEVYYEAKIIKAFFRARFAGIVIDRKIVEPIGTIDHMLLEHLHETKSVADMGVVLKKTEYGDFFSKDYVSVEEFDIALEKKMHEQIHKTITKLSVYDKEAIMEIFRIRRYVREILTLLKLRIRNADKKMQEHVVSSFEITSIVNIEKILATKDLKSFVDCFNNTEYYDALKIALDKFNKEGNYLFFERELYSYYHEKIVENELKYNIGPYRVISYIHRKRIEQKNLLILAKGIMAEMDKKMIEEMLI